MSNQLQEFVCLHSKKKRTLKSKNKKKEGSKGKEVYSSQTKSQEEKSLTGRAEVTPRQGARYLRSARGEVYQQQQHRRLSIVIKVTIDNGS